MTDILNLVEDKETSEFYPTPEKLIDRVLEGLDLRYIQNILEPSAGRGDIIKGIARKINSDYRYNKQGYEIDAIEIDGNLRSILKYNFSEEQKYATRNEIEKLTDREYTQIHKCTVGENNGKYYSITYSYEKGTVKVIFDDKTQDKLDELYKKLNEHMEDDSCVRIVHDDFLTYTPYKEYDLIIMNPPFSCADKHLLKALDMQKHGGKVVCILNAETLNNPYTETRKKLNEILKSYDAEIEYVKDAFKDADRKTDVTIAVVTVNIPKNEGFEDSIYDRLAKTEHYEEEEFKSTEVDIADFIKSIINRYSLEIKSGIELIRTYNRMKPYLKCDFKENDSYYLINLTDGKNNITINSYVKSVRSKYWSELLNNSKILDKLTSSLQEEYRKKVRSFSDYDFSEYNIRTLINEINSQVKSGIENEIEKLYDTLTAEHSWYSETCGNRYLYNGWKTNKAWKIGKKSILPCYNVFSSWSGNPDSYKAYEILSDIERTLDFFKGETMADIDLSLRLRNNFETGNTKNIHCKFFDVTFYKKGTVHITYTCPELIDRFNIYVGRNRNWLPTSYGTKKYENMDAEEKAVIDSFQGEEAYKKVLANKGYYLASPSESTTKMLSIAG